MQVEAGVWFVPVYRGSLAGLASCSGVSSSAPSEVGVLATSTPTWVMVIDGPGTCGALQETRLLTR